MNNEAYVEIMSLILDHCLVSFMPLILDLVDISEKDSHLWSAVLGKLLVSCQAGLQLQDEDQLVRLIPSYRPAKLLSKILIANLKTINLYLDDNVYRDCFSNKEWENLVIALFGDSDSRYNTVKRLKNV